MYSTIHHELRHARNAWPGTLVDLCFLSVLMSEQDTQSARVPLSRALDILYCIWLILEGVYWTRLLSLYTICTPILYSVNMTQWTPERRRRYPRVLAQHAMQAGLVSEIQYTPPHDLIRMERPRGAATIFITERRICSYTACSTSANIRR